MESHFTYACNTARNCYLGQTAAFLKRITAYALQLTVALKRYSLQVGAIVESIRVYACDCAGNCDRR